MASTLDAFGRVDILINNAGLGKYLPIEDESLDWFRQVMEINVTAYWHLAKLVARTMITQGSGSIVNVASMLGMVASAPIKSRRCRTPRRRAA